MYVVVFSPSVGEGGPFPLVMGDVLKSGDLLKAAGAVFDVFSYHYYRAASIRGKKAMPQGQTTEDVALSEDWLSRTDMVETYYAGLRVKVIMHNTLDASDYGLLDENTYEPRPNYWGALLWRRCMGTTVFDAGPSPVPTLHMYAHSLRGVPGGVALLVINTDQTAPGSFNVATAGERYTLTAKDLSAKVVQLNGSDLQLGPDDALPTLKGTPTEAGKLTFPPASITFLAVRGADNTSAR